SSGRGSGSRARHRGGLSVLLADTIVRAANLRGFDLDFDLLTSWRDVYEFSCHVVDSLQWCERGDSNPHTFRYQILSLARLPIPPLSRSRFTFSKREKNITRECVSHRGP